ncbi:MAG: hypothetical protein GY820_18255 [Gammaproteobacteria bacterium]|nr:hypothetical protein [Gammaproteobacteria bacterium]
MTRYYMEAGVTDTHRHTHARTHSDLDAARIMVAPPSESKKVQLVDLRSLIHQLAHLEKY